MNKFFKIFLIILVFLFSKHPNGLTEDEKIKIGLLVPLSGDNKNLGEQMPVGFAELIPHMRRDTGFDASRADGD